MSFDPSNILVIDLGQLGDVVLSLPALSAIREKFPHAHVTMAVSKAGAQVIDLAGDADATIVLDRKALRDKWKAQSLFRLTRVVREVRRAHFDFVIDLHSLAETNLLGFLSGAPKRLYARRPGRSLDFLANFRPVPPVADNRPTKHAVDRYLDVLVPLGVKDAPRIPRLKTRAADDAAIEQMLKKEKANVNAPLVGLFPGAGYPGRRWPLARFVELAGRLVRDDGVRIVLFAGPEERRMVKEMRAAFPRTTITFDRLNIPQLAAAFARLSVFVSDNAGPAQIAAAVGASVVALPARPNASDFVPLEAHHRVIHSRSLAEMTTAEVYDATRELLAAGRTETLFAS